MRDVPGAGAQRARLPCGWRWRRSTFDAASRRRGVDLVARLIRRARPERAPDPRGPLSTHESWTSRGRWSRRRFAAGRPRRGGDDQPTRGSGRSAARGSSGRRSGGDEVVVLGAVVAPAGDGNVTRCSCSCATARPTRTRWAAARAGSTRRCPSWVGAQAHARWPRSSRPTPASSRARCSARARPRPRSGVAVEVDERWIELDYGAVRRHAGRRRPARRVGASGVPIRTSRPPGGESLASVGQRGSGARARAARRGADRDVVVVSHVSPIKAAIALGARRRRRGRVAAVRAGRRRSPRIGDRTVRARRSTRSTRSS